MKLMRDRRVLPVILAAVALTLGGMVAVSGQDAGQRTIERHGSVIRVRPDKYDEYKELHAAVWPEVLAKLRECNIRNYSIYFKDGFLFSYFEYTGDDFEADMAKMAADPKTQEWWKVTDPCQRPLPTRAEGEWWAEMEELFHMD